MSWTRFLYHLFCFIPFIVSLPARGDFSQEGTPDPAACGPNAVYCFLKLCGRQPCPEILRTLRPVDERGMSLAEIRDALQAEGLEVELSFCAGSVLRSFRTPCIIYSSDVGSTSGHYQVVCSISGDCAMVLDPTSGQMTNLELSAWEGPVIARPNPRLSIRRLGYGVAALAAAITLFRVISRRIRRCANGV
jgi:hypothetical protein